MIKMQVSFVKSKIIKYTYGLDKNDVPDIVTGTQYFVISN